MQRRRYEVQRQPKLKHAWQLACGVLSVPRQYMYWLYNKVEVFTGHTLPSATGQPRLCTPTNTKLYNRLVLWGIAMSNNCGLLLAQPMLYQFPKNGLLGRVCYFNLHDVTITNGYEMTSARTPFAALHNYKLGCQPNVLHLRIMQPQYVLKVDQIRPPRHLHVYDLHLLYNETPLF